MRKAHKATSNWISINTQYPYKEDYYNKHPHRPIIKVGSHQLDTDRKPTRRHPTFIPNKAPVAMNDFVDRTIYLNFPLIFRGLPYNKPIPPDWTFDTHGLRFTLFVG